MSFHYEVVSPQQQLQQLIQQKEKNQIELQSFQQQNQVTQMEYQARSQQLNQMEEYKKLYFYYMEKQQILQSHQQIIQQLQGSKQQKVYKLNELENIWISKQQELNQQRQQISFRQNAVQSQMGNNLGYQQQQSQYSQSQTQSQYNQISQLNYPLFILSPGQKPYQVYSRRDLQDLKNQFQNSEKIKNMIQTLSQSFDSWRPIRGDGNCYFRAVGFAYLEYLIRDTTVQRELEQFLRNLQEAKGYFTVRKSINYQNQTHYKLRQTFIELIKFLLQNRESNDILILLEQKIANNENNYDDALVWEMRTLTANYLEMHKQFFIDFNIN